MTNIEKGSIDFITEELKSNRISRFAKPVAHKKMSIINKMGMTCICLDLYTLKLI